jgi:hypothetical protein
MAQVKCALNGTFWNIWTVSETAWHLKYKEK